MIYLSYILDVDTPTYGNRNQFQQIKKSNMDNGDIANDSHISTTVHTGTHIDMPYYFFNDGKTIEDYKADFWIFKNPLILEVNQEELIVNEKLVNKLKNIQDIGYDILIVKTSICNMRDNESFWKENYGFHPDIYDYINNKFSSIRVFGFDSISVSSFTNRMLGRESHKRFLNPKNPILLLEGMDLRDINENTNISKTIVLPLRILKCDGLPFTVFGFFDD